MVIVCLENLVYIQTINHCFLSIYQTVPKTQMVFNKSWIRGWLMDGWIRATEREYFKGSKINLQANLMYKLPLKISYVVHKIVFNIYTTYWTLRYHFSIKPRAFFFCQALVWAPYEGYGLLQGHDESQSSRKMLSL